MSEKFFDLRHQSERLATILPENNFFGHPYCPKNDTFWYRRATRNDRLSSGLFEINRNSQYCSYLNQNGQITINSEGQTNIFTHIASDLVSFTGLIDNTPWLFSRPADQTQQGLVFPHLDDLRNNNYNPYGIYFAIRPIDANPDDIEKITRYFSSF